MKPPTLTIDTDKKCTECKKPGATDGGLCLKCIADRMSKKADEKAAGGGYTCCQEAEEMAEKVIAAHHPRLATAKIAYLMRMLERDAKGTPILPKSQPRAGRKRSAGRARKVSALWQTLTGFDFVIEIREQFWRFMKAEQKEALIDHELCHCGADEAGCYIHHHDVEEFKVILERHGFWHAELEEFCTAQKSLPFEDANTESNHAA